MEVNNQFKWIIKLGWKGLCPRCGEGHMFRSFLKLNETCEECGLDYRFASPDDGPAFFVLCIVALPLIGFLAWFQIAIKPPFWVYVFVALPLLLIGCLLPLRPIKGWLVASQYVNKAQEAGTEKLWTQLHGLDKDDDGKPS